MKPSDLPPDAWLRDSSKIHTITFDERTRQLIIMALAMLWKERPGFRMAIEEAALIMDKRNPDGRPEMLCGFLDIWTAPTVAVLEGEDPRLEIGKWPIGVPPGKSR